MLSPRVRTEAAHVDTHARLTTRAAMNPIAAAGGGESNRERSAAKPATMK